MASRRLENAAAAAGFAMVNPDDFAREAKPVAHLDTQSDKPISPDTRQSSDAPRSWLKWDYLRLTSGGKAPA